MTNVQKVVEAVVVKAACPFQKTERLFNGYAAYTEIRIGGDICADGFIRSLCKVIDHESWSEYRTDEVWTGHFHGQKFTLDTESLVFMLEKWSELHRLDSLFPVLNASNFEEARKILAMDSKEFMKWRKSQRTNLRVA